LKRLWTRWDTITLAAYEALALPIAFFVHGDWQFLALIAGVLALVVVARPLIKHTERGAGLRASIPRGTRSAPFWVSILAGTVVMVAISLVLRALGAGHSDGWLLVSVGGINPAVNITDRWWTARARAPA
jgi:hypothetical protein